MAKNTNPVQDLMIQSLDIVESVLNGTIWEKPADDIAADQKTLANVLAGLKFAGKKFDEALVNSRKLDNEAFAGVEFFRKPRESKTETVSLESIFQS